MDKYEYKLRSEQIQDLISKKEYAKAMQVADSIDWSRVKNVTMLTTVSDIYKINRRYDAAKDLLLFAYDRSPGKRSIVYSLCELCIKLGEFVQAVEYFKEFNAVAPTDPGRYILKYKIYDAQEVSIEERISVLEALKTEEYRPKWGYELAYLYHRAGSAQKCIAECDELILTFGDGKYVLKAMELKKLHTPLNPVQQDKYDTFMGVKVKPITTDAAQKSLQRPDLMAASTKVMPSREIDIQVRTMDVENKYNTMNIQAALADSMKEIMAKDEIERQSIQKAAVQQSSAPAPQVQQAQVQARPASPAFAQQVSAQAAPIQEVSVEQQPTIQMNPVYEQPQIQPLEAAERQAQSPQDITQFIPSENMEEILPSAGMGVATPIAQPQAAYAYETDQPQQAPVYQETQVYQEQKPQLAFDPNMDTAQLIQNMTARAEAAAPSPYESMVSQEGDGQISLVVPEEAKVEKQITGQMNIGDIMDEWEKKKDENERRSMDDIRQRMVRQTGRIFSDFNKSANSGMLEGLEDMNNPLSNLPIKPVVPAPAPKTHAEILIESALEDNKEEFPEVEELSEILEPGDDTEENIAGNLQSALGLGEPVREDDFIAEPAVKVSPVIAPIPVAVAAPVINPIPAAVSAPKVNPVPAPEMEYEAPSEDDFESDEECASEYEAEYEPEEQYEQNAPSASGEEFTVGADFSTSEIADVAEKLLEETERQVTGASASSESVAASSRSLTDDERELFGALIQTDQMKDQIATAIDAVSLASYTGNVIITGEAGSGTLTLAKNLIKSVQMSDNNFSGKAAKITGASLDKQDIEKTLSKLKNGALIIEKASGMSASTLQKLCGYLDADREDGIIVILEGTKMDIRKLLQKYPDATQCFNARIDISAMDSDALVAYAKEYAYEQEYAIDEMGVLAIYTRISDLQSGDHSVTLQEVRDIMDEGIWSANRKTIGHYFDILSGKRYDDEDMIILREKDFIC